MINHLLVLLIGLYLVCCIEKRTSSSKETNENTVKVSNFSESYRPQFHFAPPQKWMLLVSIHPEGPNGGSATQYFVGDFDGQQFTTSQQEAKWIDYDMDNYAGITYNNTPNGEHLFNGWMSNWNYAPDTPAKTWRSAMALPRLLTLSKGTLGYFLKRYLHPNFKEICNPQEIATSINLSESFAMQAESWGQTDFSFKADLSKNLEVSFGNASGKVVFQVGPEAKQPYFNRSQSGMTDFEEGFGAEIQLQPYTLLAIKGPAQELSQVKYHTVKSIWNEQQNPFLVGYGSFGRFSFWF